MKNEFDFLIYTTPFEEISIHVVVKEETIWLTQKAMAELFEVEVPVISKHLSNIYSEGELRSESTVSKMEIVQREGTRDVKQTLEHYCLDAIISVGYRVNSRRATHFRIWATSVLREYIVKGFVLNEKRLKQGKRAFGKDYFRELISKEQAEAKAVYNEFNKTQKIDSDFEKETQKWLQRGGSNE